MINEDNFLKGLKKKDIKVLDYIVDNYSNIIFKVAFGVLNSRELSEECVNDVLLKIWDNGHKFNKQKNKFYTWVVAIAKYTAIDLLRKEVKYSNSVDLDNCNIGQASNIERDFEHKERLRNVTEEINNMRQIDKEIFIRRFYKCESNKEIGRNLGLTEKFVNLRVFRGRKKLLEKFQKEDF